MERLEYCRVPGMPGVEVLLAERSARLWRVYHETYAICSLLRLGGAVTRWTYRGKLHASHAEGLMLMEPGEVHVNPRHANPLPVRPADFRALFISPALIECAAADLGVDAQPHLKLAHSADPLLFHAFARFHASLERSASVLEREPRRSGARTRCAAPAPRADGEPRGVSGVDRLEPLPPGACLRQGVRADAARVSDPLRAAAQRHGRVSGAP